MTLICQVKYLRTYLALRLNQILLLLLTVPLIQILELHLLLILVLIAKYTPDSTFLYNPNDNQLYVDNLTVSTQINLPTTVSIALGVFDDITVSNTATILNLEVESLEANGVAFTGTGGDVTTTSATVIDSFPIAQTRGFKYFIHRRSY